MQNIQTAYLVHKKERSLIIYPITEKVCTPNFISSNKYQQ